MLCPSRAILPPTAAVLVAATLPAQVTFHHDRGRELVAADAKVEKVVAGRQFTEGPVWLADRAQLLFSDIPANSWFVWSAKDGGKPWQGSAGANGNTLDREGRVLSCQHEARNIVRHEADGSRTVLVDSHDGKLLNSPNDAAVRADGTIWFTDPTYGLGKREREQAGNFVYRFEPATRTTSIVQRDFDQPNGLCFSPDHARLWVADSGKLQRVGLFPVGKDGTLGAAERWLEGGSDGMRCDRAGNLFTTARDGVRIHGPDGVHLVTIALPEQPANCAFGGEHGTTLFVTARTSVYALSVLTTGAAMPKPAPAVAPDGK
ncbi:MAG: SMP-30/gluconolactonase/LRE family protein [Planctomycetota bacterium]